MSQRQYLPMEQLMCYTQSRLKASPMPLVDKRETGGDKRLGEVRKQP